MLTVPARNVPRVPRSRRRRLFPFFDMFYGRAAVYISGRVVNTQINKRGGGEEG